MFARSVSPTPLGATANRSSHIGQIGSSPSQHCSRHSAHAELPCLDWVRNQDRTITGGGENDRP